LPRSWQSSQVEADKRRPTNDSAVLDDRGADAAGSRRGCLAVGGVGSCPADTLEIMD